MTISAAPPVGWWRGPASNGWLPGCVPERLALCCASTPPGSPVMAATDSADAAARHYGVPLAFCDAEKLARHPDVDLVAVSVKVPDHYQLGRQPGRAVDWQD